MTFDESDYLSPEEIREMVLAAVDPSSFAVAAAIGGGITLDDLWFFYDEHRIVIDGSGWLLAMLAAGDLSEEESRVLDRLDFWAWYDKGRRAL